VSESDIRWVLAYEERRKGEDRGQRGLFTFVRLAIRLDVDRMRCARYLG